MKTAADLTARLRRARLAAERPSDRRRLRHASLHRIAGRSAL